MAAPPPPAKPSKMSVRQRVAEEILMTERGYVRDLETLLRLYVLPLRTNGVMSGADHSTMFQSIEQLVVLNQKLLADIEEEHSTMGGGAIGKLFADFAPYLKMYSAYVDNHDAAVQASKRLKGDVAFRTFCETQAMAPESRGQTLDSFLIMPVQRVPRYMLLLKELLKRTEPDHTDYPDLQRALAMVEEAASHINEAIRHRENLDKIREIQEREKADIVAPARVFLKEGTLRKVCRRGPKEFRFYLFNDMLMYCGGEGPLGRSNRMIPLARCKVIKEKWESEPDAFRLESPSKSFWVLGSGTQRASTWAGDIEQCIEDQGGEDEFEAAAMWEPDDTAANCSLCSAEFTLFKRRHHCRNCGALVCNSCSSNKWRIPHITTKTPVRVCSTCYTTLRESHQYALGSRPMGGGAGAGTGGARGGVASETMASGVNPSFDPTGRRGSRLIKSVRDLKPVGAGAKRASAPHVTVTPAKYEATKLATKLAPVPAAPARAATAAPRPSPLPPGWEEVKTAEGEVYYWNEKTDQTSWDRPGSTPVVKPKPKPASGNKAVPAALPAPWEVAYAGDAAGAAAAAAAAAVATEEPEARGRSASAACNSFDPNIFDKTRCKNCGKKLATHSS